MMKQTNNNNNKKKKSSTRQINQIVVHYESSEQLAQLQQLISQTLLSRCNLLFHQSSPDDNNNDDEAPDEREEDKNENNSDEAQNLKRKKKKKKQQKQKSFAKFQHLVNEMQTLVMFHKRYERILRCDTFMIKAKKLIRRFNKYRSEMESGVLNRVSSLVSQFEFSSNNVLSFQLTSSVSEQPQQKSVSSGELQTIHGAIHGVLLYFLQIAQMIEQMRGDVWETSRYLFNELSTFHKTTFVRSSICLACMARIHAVLCEYSFELNECYNVLVHALSLLPKQKDVMSYLKGKQSIVYKYTTAANDTLDGYNIYKDQLAKYLNWDAEEGKQITRRLDRFLLSHQESSSIKAAEQEGMHNNPDHSTQHDKNHPDQESQVKKKESKRTSHQKDEEIMTNQSTKKRKATSQTSSSNKKKRAT